MEYHNRALELAPDDPVILNNVRGPPTGLRGGAGVRTGGLTPGRATHTRMQAGWTAYTLGSYVDAIALFKAAVRGSDSPTFRNNLALAQGRLNAQSQP